MFGEMTRIKAFICHTLMSALIVSTVLAIVIVFWYPDPFFKVIGAMEVIRVLIFVDLVLGPLLTLVLFKPGKWGLKFDMACVFALQISALLYGVYTVYEERPYYTVFVQDRFEVLARKDVDDSAINDTAFRDKPWTEPVYIVATMPDTLEERQRVLEETLFEGKPDIHQRPEFWNRYEDNRNLVARAARPLEDLVKRRPARAAEINAAIDAYAGDDGLAYVPITARTRALVLLLDRDTWKPVGALDIDPWGPTEGSMAETNSSNSANNPANRVAAN